ERAAPRPRRTAARRSCARTRRETKRIGGSARTYSFGALAAAANDPASRGDRFVQNPKERILIRGKSALDGDDAGTRPLGDTAEIRPRESAGTRGGRHFEQRPLRNVGKPVGQRFGLGEHVERQVRGERVGAERGKDSGLEQGVERRQLDLDVEVRAR